MFYRHDETWNMRDRHMVETLASLLEPLGRHGEPAKIAVREHNSHVGDARATEIGERGELNVGPLVRERFDAQARLIAFTTYHGTVTAAEDWGQPAQRRRVRPGLPGSWEELFHATGSPQFWVDLRQPDPAAYVLAQPRLERAIGVISRPQTERGSHYFHARRAEQFDAMIHLDETQALEPLEQTAEWEAGELPETFPTGM